MLAAPSAPAAGARVRVAVVVAVACGAGAGAVPAAAPAPAAASTGGWLRPVAGELLRAFDVGSDRFAAGRHRGVDLRAPLGAAVRSACAGRVSFAGRVPGGGLTVSVRCGPLVASYGHLGSLAVARGQPVAAGARLGAVGRSGRPRTPLPHVHLGVRVAAGGRYLDPLALIGGPPSPPGAPPPARRPATPPLGRAPAPAPRRLRPPPIADPPPLPADRPLAPAVPRAAWAGLACVALALPVGGLARRRRRRIARAAVARTA